MENCLEIYILRAKEQDPNLSPEKSPQRLCDTYRNIPIKDIIGQRDQYQLGDTVTFGINYYAKRYRLKGKVNSKVKMVKPGLLSCKIDNSGVDDEENLSNLMEKSDISEEDAHSNKRKDLSINKSMEQEKKKILLSESNLSTSQFDSNKTSAVQQTNEITDKTTLNKAINLANKSSSCVLIPEKTQCFVGSTSFNDQNRVNLNSILNIGIDKENALNRRNDPSFSSKSLEKEKKNTQIAALEDEKALYNVVQRKSQKKINIYDDSSEIMQDIDSSSCVFIPEDINLVQIIKEKQDEKENIFKDRIKQLEKSLKDKEIILKTMDDEAELADMKHANSIEILQTKIKELEFTNENLKSKIYELENGSQQHQEKVNMNSEQDELVQKYGYFVSSGHANGVAVYITRSGQFALLTPDKNIHYIRNEKAFQKLPEIIEIND